MLEVEIGFTETLNTMLTLIDWRYALDDDVSDLTLSETECRSLLMGCSRSKTERCGC